MENHWSELNATRAKSILPRLNPAEQSFMRGDPFFTMDWVSAIGPVFTPAFDLIETADKYTVLGDLPGLDLGHLDLEFTTNTLTITGEREAEDLRKNISCHALERKFGSFLRTFAFPNGVLGDKCFARMKSGVLWVDIPKRRGSIVEPYAQVARGSTIEC